MGITLSILNHFYWICNIFMFHHYNMSKINWYSGNKEDRRKQNEIKGHFSLEREELILSEPG